MSACGRTDLGDDAAELMLVNVRRGVVAASQVDDAARCDQVDVVAEVSHRLDAVNVHRYLHTPSQSRHVIHHCIQPTRKSTVSYPMRSIGRVLISLT